ncbi:hypothetical protein YC2023_009286 [Brassica napus]|uniref:Uncharacterized protein n=2 Tax=Brassica oleracea TaxID=3712 RepID=A0A0D3A6I8_BRAOL|nr:unnamed protein product [Brassica oleracea]
MWRNTSKDHEFGLCVKKELRLLMQFSPSHSPQIMANKRPTALHPAISSHPAFFSPVLLRLYQTTVSSSRITLLVLGCLRLYFLA